MPSPLEPSPSNPIGHDAEVAPTTAERDRIVALLTRSYGADLLTDAELQVRLDRALQAKTTPELEGVLAGLPSEPEAGMEIDGRRVRALLSGEEQRLTGLVPRRLRLDARLGYVELDLTRATFQPGDTEIRVDAVAGYVEIRLPAGIRAQSTGHAFLGYFSLRGGQRTVAEGAPVVRITGRAFLGYMECHVVDRPAPTGALEP